MPDQTEASAGGAQVLVRLYWMFFGNAVLVFLLVAIFEKHLAFPSFLDIAYWVVLVSLLLARYVDIAELNGQTGDGAPATLAHWRRYAVFVSSMGTGAWLLIRAIVHFLK